MRVPVEVFARAPLDPLMTPLIVVLALDLISSVEVPEANVHAPLHVTGLANSVIVNVAAAFVTIPLVIVSGELIAGAESVNVVAVPHRIGPVPKEFALLKFRLELVLRFTPPWNVLLP